MPRQPRIHGSTGLHHVMNRGAPHQSIFHDDADRECFLAVSGELVDRFEFTVHTYCLMDNHYHLVAEAPWVLSEAMHRLGTVYAQRFNRRHGLDGPLFRGRFRSKPIEDEPYLVAAVRYVVRNPVGATGVAGLAGYRWSSHAAYLGATTGPSWLETAMVLGLLGGRQRYRALVEGSESPLPDEVIEAGLASEDLQTRREVEAVDAIVCQLTGVPSRWLRSRCSADTLGARQLALLLASELTVLEGVERARRYGYRNESAERVARHRARRRLAADAAFALVYSQACGRLTGPV